MRQRSDNQQLLPSRTAVTPRKAPFGTTTWIILIVFSSLSSFYVGVWATLTVASGKDCADCTSICMNAVDTGDGELGRKVGRAFSKNIERGETRPQHCLLVKMLGTYLEIGILNPCPFSLFFYSA